VLPDDLVAVALVLFGELVAVAVVGERLGWLTPRHDPSRELIVVAGGGWDGGYPSLGEPLAQLAFHALLQSPGP